MSIREKKSVGVDHFHCGLEVKLAGGSTPETMTFSGYGAVFGNVDAYGDVIQPGAFADTLAEVQKSGQWPAMLLQHGGWGMDAQSMMPVGTWTSLSEDGHGLKVEGKLLDTQAGRDTYVALKATPRPAITGLSIGYIAKEFSVRTKPEEPRRTLKKVDLMEVSLVTFPANGKARIQSVKSSDFTEREFEKLMRDAGLSKTEALIVINQGFKQLRTMRDAGSDELTQLADVIRRNTETLSPTN